jgi:hypothetical protein
MAWCFANATTSTADIAPQYGIVPEVRYFFRYAVRFRSILSPIIDVGEPS